MLLQKTFGQPEIRIKDVSPGQFHWICSKGHDHDSAAKRFRCEMGDSE